MGFSFEGVIKSNAISLFGYFYLSDNCLYLFFGVFYIFLILGFLSFSLLSKYSIIFCYYCTIVLFFDVFGGAVDKFFQITLPLFLLTLLMLMLFSKVNFVHVGSRVRV